MLYFLVHAGISVGSTTAYCKLGNGIVRNLCQDTVYTHPTTKQCNYSPDLSNVNAAKLQGYTYNQIIANSASSSPIRFEQVYSNTTVSLRSPLLPSGYDTTKLLGIIAGASATITQTNYFDDGDRWFLGINLLNESVALSTVTPTMTTAAHRYSVSALTVPFWRCGTVNTSYVREPSFYSTSSNYNSIPLSDMIVDTYNTDRDYPDITVSNLRINVIAIKGNF